MQIVIDIPEEQYNSRDYRVALISNIGEITYIGKGTPLPKGHGRLIDADVLDDVIMQMNANGAQITRYEYKVIDNVLFEMPTIIEADKEDEDTE